MKALLALFALLAIVAGAKPPEPQPIRGDEVIWTAEYKGWACGGLSPQLMPVEGVDADLDLSEITLGLEFYVPPGLTAPDQVDEVCVPGNHFLIRGHFFYHEDSGRRVVAPRFDLLGWEPVAPFRRWDEGGAVLEDEPRKAFSDFSRSESDHASSFTVAGKYAGC